MIAICEYHGVELMQIGANSHSVNPCPLCVLEAKYKRSRKNAQCAIRAWRDIALEASKAWEAYQDTHYDVANDECPEAQRLQRLLSRKRNGVVEKGR